MSWWVGVGCTNDQSHLRPRHKYSNSYLYKHFILEVHGKIFILEHHSQITSSFIVEAKVLGEGLGTEQFEASVSEVSDTPGISIQTAAGETLISTVKEGEVVLALDNISYLGPLLLARINPSGIVSAGVEDDD